MKRKYKEEFFISVKPEAFQELYEIIKQGIKLLDAPKIIEEKSYQILKIIQDHEKNSWLLKKKKQTIAAAIFYISVYILEYRQFTQIRIFNAFDVDYETARSFYRKLTKKINFRIYTMEIKNKRFSILNLTQHEATPQQIKQHVIEPSKEDKREIKNALSFNEIPSRDEISNRITRLSFIVEKYNPTSVMIGGASFLIFPLEKKLRQKWLVFHAFSKRVSTERKNADGTITKMSTFKHVGFVCNNEIAYLEGDK